MDSADFLNLASFRHYPFNSAGGFVTWSVKWVLDAQLILGVRSGYVPGTSTVASLESINKAGGDITFTFDAGGIAFAFVVADDAAYGTVVTAEGDADPAYGFGFLQVGDISDVPSGLTAGPAELIPTRVQSLHLHQVATLNAANQRQAGLVVECNDETCDIESAVIAPPATYDTALSGWDGPVAFEGGQYAAVDITPAAPSVLFGGTVDPDAGEVLPCATADLVTAEGDDLTSCRAAIYSINGVQPDPRTGLFKLSGDAGVSVTPHPTLAHRLRLTITPRLLFGAVPTPAC